MESLYEQIKKLLEELEIYEIQSQINALARQLVKIVENPHPQINYINNYNLFYQPKKQKLT